MERTTEGLFAILRVLVIAIRNYSDDLAEALQEAMSQLYRDWYETRNELDALKEKLYQMEQLESPRCDGNHLRWLLSFPPCYLDLHKIACIEALRAVLFLGLKEAKGEVERKAVAGEQLFPLNLTTSELISVVEALIGGAGPVPNNQLSISVAHSTDA